MNSKEIRAKYIKFFEERGHAQIHSAPLIPENDPTTLFTSSGMQPLMPYLLGQKHPAGTRLVDSQKCFRAEDILDVGDNRHTTFFEMLGNWSLGDYFKKEQLPWLFEFLTKEIGLDPKRFYVTVFAGDERAGIPRDTEAVTIWKKLFAGVSVEAKDIEILTEENGALVGMQGGRIFYYTKKNWWSRAGTAAKMPAGEPGGPDSELFYEFDGIKHDSKFGKLCHPNCDCGRYMEVANSVFMEYKKKTDGGFEKLAKQNVDFGGGLERMIAASNDEPDMFQIDFFAEAMKKILSMSPEAYNGENRMATRVVLDHMRSSIFLIGDGVLPSNTEQGYMLRRMLRRAVRFANKLNIPEGGIVSLVAPLIAAYDGYYEKVSTQMEHIQATIADEEEKFRKTLRDGLRVFERLSKGTPVISGADAFILFSTYGFPVELTDELARERGLTIDMAAYEEEFKKHQELSRVGAEKKFKGGLADTGETSVKYHTATHMLHKALREVLGTHVFQKGSNITAERLRFDFSHGEKMTPEQIKRVEDLINEKIKAELPVSFEEVPIEEARARGALGLFGDKYGERVTIYQIGGQPGLGETGDKTGIFSLEICGGPHVKNTKELGHFKVVKEEACSAGVRRIKAVVE